jgi:RNA polymerase subunit RPABC4/transcription elongation factor Spt4
MAKEEEIKDLKKLIEKMKCCGNCKYQDSEEYTGCPVCSLGEDCSKKINGEFVLTKWELAE